MRRTENHLGFFNSTTTMDLSRILHIVTFFAIGMIQFVSGGFVFNVTHKFAGKDRQLHELIAHDNARHGGMLANVDLPLGGDARTDSIGLYFTKIQLGTPPKDYHVQIDTGSDLLWVNCAPCPKCIFKTDIGVNLSLYDSKASSTSKILGCDEKICRYIAQTASCGPKKTCQYSVQYGDGSATNGDVVRDNITLQQTTGKLQTAPLSQAVVFGCGSNPSGLLVKTDSGVDGILGLAQSAASLVGQLAGAGKVKRVISHCLDNKKGGGIFAIGEVDFPVVKTTPLDPKQGHYVVMLKGIDVGGEPVDVPPCFIGGTGKTIIDSGSTLAYVPEVLHKQLIQKITAKQPDVKVHMVQGTFACFSYTMDIDKAFPVVNLHFEDNLKLTVHPHDYLFSLRVDMYCIGWQPGGPPTPDGTQMILLGDLVLSNKLVVHDQEKQVIGWADHDCSTSIKMKDAARSQVTRHNNFAGNNKPLGPKLKGINVNNLR